MDDDLIVGFLGLLFCAAPVGFLFFIGWAMSQAGKKDPRIPELERELAETKGELAALARRLEVIERLAERARADALDAARMAAPVTSPVAPSTVPIAEVAPPIAPSPPVEAPAAPSAAVAPEPPVAEPTPAPETAASIAVSEPAATPAVEATLPPATPAAATIATPAAPTPWTAELPAPPPPSAALEATPSGPPPPPEEGGLERWLGVRGAAAAGAIVLAIAGAYFFEYSIEHGLIGPAMRVVLGMLVGLGCVVASEWPLREKAPALSGWVAGAGIAILYTASWAAHAIYDLVPSWASGALMVAVTGACVALSARRSSLPTAVLGLAGGFITPLALSTGEDHPVPLFSYLLLLDVGLLWLSHRKKWPALAWLSLFGTAAYQLLWMSARMSNETGLVGIVIVLGFAVLYGVFATLRAKDPAASHEEEAEAERSWLAGVSTILPFLLSLTFVGRDVLSAHAWVVGALLVVLSIGALVVAWRTRAPFLALAAAASTLGVLLVWMATHPLDDGLAWELVLTLLVLTAVFHVRSELDRETGTLASAASLSLFGGLFLAMVASLSASCSLVPFEAFAVVGTIVAARQAERPGRHLIGVASGLALAAQLFACELVGPAESATFQGALSMVLVALFQIYALLPRSPEARAGADHGAALAALTLAIFRTFDAWSSSVPIELASQVALAALVLFAASRRAAPAWSAASLAVSASAATLAVVTRGAHDDALASLPILGATVVLFAIWPAIGGARYRRDPWAWRASAMAGPLFFFVLRTAWTRAFGTAQIGILPVSLAVISLGSLWLARTRGPEEAAARRTALAWPAAITAGFVTLAIPLQLSNEWITIGWALEAAAVLWLFRRIDHAGLKWLSAALFVAVAVRLLVNPYVLGYYPRGEIRIVNWIAYTYLVPAAAMIAGTLALAPIEAERLRPLEQTLYPSRTAWLARTLFAGALLTIFAWINLAIFDWFATGPSLSIPTEHMPARDLTISIAWAVYALSLLALGVWRQSSGLRWTSLALVIVTCFKVFLYDLAHLEDLYRVAALVGLAFSLLSISLLYQRFVFRRAPVPESPR
ncbi:MAG: DUF2339 domain-containing protein [Sandaracinus sp.]